MQQDTKPSAVQAHDMLEPQQDFAVAPVSASDMVLDAANMKQIMDFAKFMASGSTTVPNHLKGNAADCAAVLTQAMMWKMNPFAVAQKTHLVSGQLGYEGQLVNAAIIGSGVLEGRPNYEWFGDWTKVIGKYKIKQGKEDPAKPGKSTEYRVPDWKMEDEDGLGIIVRATIKGESEPRELILLLSQARVRNSPLWADDPRQQMAYLGIKRWARLHTPDVILGVYTPDELDNGGSIKDVTPARPGRTNPAEVAKDKAGDVPDPSPALLKKAGDAADKGREAFDKFWATISQDERRALRKGSMPGLQARCEAAAASTTQRRAAAATAEDATVTDTSSFVQDMDRASSNDYTPE